MSSRRQTYTSYYANCVELNRAGIILISIALYPPRNWHSLEYKKLAPSFDILLNYKHDHDETKYTERYKSEILNKLNVDEVMTDLVRMAGKSNEFALICYENPSVFCHRHVVANWLTEHGYPCEEYHV